MKSEIKIEVDGGALGDLVVCGMKLREGLSEPYRAEVTAFSEQPRTPAKLRDEALGRRVSLRIVQDVEKEGTVTRYLCGIVTSVAHLGAKIQDAEVVSFCGTQKRRLSSYRLTIEPQLAQLAFTRRTLDYPDTTPLGAIKAVLNRNRISFDAGQYLDQEEYAGKVRFVQRDETDLAFIHRVMARYGISYTFTHAANGDEQMVLSSGNDYPAPSALEFNGLEGYADGKEVAFSTEVSGNGVFRLTGFRAESRTGFTGLKDGFLRPAQTKALEKEAGDMGTSRVWYGNEAPAGYGENVDDTTLDKDFERFAAAKKTAMRLAGDDWRGETPHLAAMPGKVLRITGFVDGEDGADEPVKARVTHADLAIDLLKQDDEVFRLTFAAQDFADDLQEKRWVPGEREEGGGKREEGGGKREEGGVKRKEALFPSSLNLIETVVCDRSGKIDDEGTKNTIVTSPHSTAEMPWVFLVRNPNPGDGDGIGGLIDVAMTMPLGGKRAGLYHFPRVGERVFVMLTGDRAVLMGYVPDRTGSFGDFPEGGDKWARNSTSLRYTPPTGEAKADGAYGEIGFSHVSTAAEAMEQRIIDGTAVAALISAAVERNDIACYNGIFSTDVPRIDAARQDYFASPGKESSDAVSSLARDLVTRYGIAESFGGTALRMFSGGTIVQYANDGIEIATPGALRITAGEVTINGRRAVNVQSEGVIRNSVDASTSTVNPNGVVLRSQRVLDASGEYDSAVTVGAVDGVQVSGANVRLNGLFTAQMSDALGGRVAATNGELQCAGAAVDLATVTRAQATEAFNRLSETSGLDRLNEVMGAWKGGSTPDGSPRQIADRSIGPIGLTGTSPKSDRVPLGNFRGTVSGVAIAGENLSDGDGWAGSDAELNAAAFNRLGGANPDLTVTQRELLRAQAFARQMDAHAETAEAVIGTAVDGKSSSVTIHGHQLDLNVQVLKDFSEQHNADAGAGGGNA